MPDINTNANSDTQTSISYRLPYWQNGESDLKEAISHFLDYVNSLSLPSNETINISAPTDAEVNLLRQYISVWMSYTGWKIKKEDKQSFQALKNSALGIQSFPEAKSWLTSAIYFGIDPF